MLKQEKLFNEKCYKTIEIYNKSKVPYTHHDKSEIKKIQELITRKASYNQKNKKFVINLTSNELYTKPSSKRNLLSFINRNKLSKKNKKEKNKEILTINEISELEIEEKKMALREHAAEVRKKEVEAEVLEIVNA
ncbi:hypothetical protein C1645_840069 [Glomus cerebriforme]|uniref:Uncharacterized protein n=1 Tax=Glomus cerebriforme TaxID=658196 RepID=A0A397S4Q7_9GLOM|nr:hypothetical protein C1645_840069 [Glomus cerebriforme]